MNAQNNVINNQEQIFMHIKLSSDAAYQWSVENNSVFNMQMVLRAHGKDCSLDAAIKQLEIAATF